MQADGLELVGVRVAACGWRSASFMMAIYPAFIAPLFNKFSPMQEGDLKARIEAAAGQVRLQARSGLFVMDGSQRSSHGNAYFTGFGKTKRIVFFDTLISRLDEDGDRGRAGARARALQAAPRDRSAWPGPSS